MTIIARNKGCNGKYLGDGENFRLADQEYFERHPGETVYIRSPFPGEFPEVRQPKKVQVHQIEVGMRTRMPIW
jgi:hypothetical protein